MQNVRFLTSVSTADRSYTGGEEASISSALAGQWVACGFVELVGKPVSAPVTKAIAAEPAVEIAPVAAKKPGRNRRP